MSILEAKKESRGGTVEMNNHWGAICCFILRTYGDTSHNFVILQTYCDCNISQLCTNINLFQLRRQIKLILSEWLPLEMSIFIFPMLDARRDATVPSGFPSGWIRGAVGSNHQPRDQRTTCSTSEPAASTKPYTRVNLILVLLHALSGDGVNRIMSCIFQSDTVNKGTQ